VGTERTLLAELGTAELHALRVAAQVMRHKADLDERPLVADYFNILGNLCLAELGRRGEGLRVIPAVPVLALDVSADADDRRVLAEYLGLLIGNERLSTALRDVSRQLRSRDCRA
jgi:hypothetical protein